ncbi:hypothetical protein RHGRI_008912 [Rhododendron griersonianum]|uniref:RRM domain-containing protein n=1 Tax=Rhododendron griersonianum TaxID=479676 RepID=A0AAV6L260_9ERIC|nr:hypothetical protein RHGRI_008912 [Rhododendron griersonianum]
MPMFISEEEYESCSHDASLVAEKADAFIRELYNQLEKYKGQTRSGALPLLPHQIYLKASDQKDGEIIERLSTEASELRALLEHKNSEISEKKAAINGYLDEMETLTCSAALKEARLEEIELELAQSRASCTRLSQELSSSKDAAVANQERYLAEISTATTRAGLYKALKDSYERTLEWQKSSRKEFEKEAACLKEKLKKEYEAEVEKNKDLKEKLKKYEAEVEKNKEKLEKHEAGVETNSTQYSEAKRPVDWDPKKIFVGGIPRTVTEDKFKEFFSAYGTVLWHEIIRDLDSGLPRGFGFVVFDSAQVVDNILINGNYIDMEGTKVEIKRAQPKEKPAPAPAPSYGSLPGFSGGYNRVVFIEGWLWKP